MQQSQFSDLEGNCQDLQSLEAAETPQRFRVLTMIAEDLSSVPEPMTGGNTAACNSNSKGCKVLI